MTGVELRRLWIEVVKALLGVGEYHVAKRFDGYFERAAVLIDRERIDGRLFCEAQVRWAIGRNFVVYPSLLGGRSLDRYRELPKEEDRLRDLREELAYDLEELYRTVKQRGIDFALGDRYYGHSPLVMSYVRWQFKREIPTEVVEQARRQVEGERLWLKVLPEDFVREVLR